MKKLYILLALLLTIISLNAELNREIFTYSGSETTIQKYIHPKKGALKVELKIEADSTHTKKNSIPISISKKGRTNELTISKNTVDEGGKWLLTVDNPDSLEFTLRLLQESTKNDSTDIKAITKKWHVDEEKKGEIKTYKISPDGNTCYTDRNILKWTRMNANPNPMNFEESIDSISDEEIYSTLNANYWQIPKNSKELLKNLRQKDTGDPLYVLHKQVNNTNITGFTLGEIHGKYKNVKQSVNTTKKIEIKITQVKSDSGKIESVENVCAKIYTLAFTKDMANKMKFPKKFIPENDKIFIVQIYFFGDGFEKRSQCNNIIWRTDFINKDKITKKMKKRIKTTQEIIKEEANKKTAKK